MFSRILRSSIDTISNTIWRSTRSPTRSDDHHDQHYRISLRNDENECVVDNERDVSKDLDNQLVVRLNRLNEDVYFNVLVVLDFNDNVHVIFDVLVVLDFNDNVHVIFDVLVVLNFNDIVLDVFDVLVILVFESCPQKSAMIRWPRY